jgi:hypothetical protein
MCKRLHTNTGMPAKTTFGEPKSHLISARSFAQISNSGRSFRYEMRNLRFVSPAPRSVTGTLRPEAKIEHVVFRAGASGARIRNLRGESFRMVVSFPNVVNKNVFAQRCLFRYAPHPSPPHTHHLPLRIWTFRVLHDATSLLTCIALCMCKRLHTNNGMKAKTTFWEPKSHPRLDLCSIIRADFEFGLRSFLHEMRSLRFVSPRTQIFPLLGAAIEGVVKYSVRHRKGFACFPHPATGLSTVPNIYVSLDDARISIGCLVCRSVMGTLRPEAKIEHVVLRAGASGTRIRNLRSESFRMVVSFPNVVNKNVFAQRCLFRYAADPTPTPHTPTPPHPSPPHTPISRCGFGHFRASAKCRTPMYLWRVLVFRSGVGLLSPERTTSIAHGDT